MARERPRRGNKCEFQHNQLPSIQTSRDRSPTCPTNFFLFLRPSPFSRPPVQTTVNRAKISGRLRQSICLRPDGDRIGIAVRPRDLSRRGVELFQYSANATVFIRVSAPSAEMPPERGLKKSLFALRGAFCIEYFPIPKCPVFFFARWP